MAELRYNKASSSGRLAGENIPLRPNAAQSTCNNVSDIELSIPYLLDPLSGYIVSGIFEKIPVWVQLLAHLI